MKKRIYNKVIIPFLTVIISTAGMLLLNTALRINYGADSYVAALPGPFEVLAHSPEYDSARIVGLKLDPEDQYRMQFIVDPGTEDHSGRCLEDEVKKAVNCFIAAMAVPEDKLWVNLSPYEPDRIIDSSLVKTELGRDMLAQDYLLKQLSSSLTHPDTPAGRAYWGIENRKLKMENGLTQISNIESLTAAERAALSKIWIKPDKIVVYEDDTSAFIAEANLLLEAEHGSGLQMLIPSITQEVNHGRYFADLRQIYNSVILASWFKNRFVKSVYSGYFDSQKISGIDVVNSRTKESIYHMYLTSLRRGVYEKYLPVAGSASKQRLFSGGVVLAVSSSSVFKPLCEFTSGFKRKLLTITGRMRAQRMSAEAEPETKSEINTAENAVPAEFSGDDALDGMEYDENYIFGYPVNKDTINALYARHAPHEFGGKSFWTEVLHELKESRPADIPDFFIPGSDIYLITEIWKAFFRHNSQRIEQGNILALAENYEELEILLEKLEYDTIPHVKEDIASVERGMLEQNKFIDSIIRRSSSSWEDAMTDSHAGLFESTNDKYIEGVKYLIHHFLNVVWLRRGKIDFTGQCQAVKDTIPRVVTEDEGLGILIQEFISFNKSFVAMSDQAGKVVVEGAFGDASNIVNPQYGNTTQYMKDKSTAKLEYEAMYERVPFEFKINGVSYSMDRVDTQKMAKYLKELGYQPINGVFIPLSEDETLMVCAVIEYFERSLGFPVDIEGGFDGQKMYITQLRPMAGKLDSVLDFPQNLDPGRAFVKTSVSLGNVDTVARIVLLDDNVTASELKEFEKQYGDEYILVRRDAAGFVLNREFNAQCVIDPQQGSRNAHSLVENYESISEGRMSYSAGRKLKSAFAKLDFSGTVFRGIYLSENNVRVFADGTQSWFFDEGPAESECAIKTVSMSAAYERVREMFTGSIDEFSGFLDGLPPVVRNFLPPVPVENGTYNDRKLRLLEEYADVDAFSMEAAEQCIEDIETLREAMDFPLFSNTWEGDRRTAVKYDIDRFIAGYYQKKREYARKDPDILLELIDGAEKDSPGAEKMKVLVVKDNCYTDMILSEDVKRAVTMLKAYDIEIEFKELVFSDISDNAGVLSEKFDICFVDFSNSVFSNRVRIMLNNMDPAGKIIGVFPQIDIFRTVEAVQFLNIFDVEYWKNYNNMLDRIYYTLIDSYHRKVISARKKKNRELAGEMNVLYLESYDTSQELFELATIGWEDDLGIRLFRARTMDEAADILSERKIHAAFIDFGGVGLDGQADFDQLYYMFSSETHPVVGLVSKMYNPSKEQMLLRAGFEGKDIDKFDDPANFFPDIYETLLKAAGSRRAMLGIEKAEPEPLPTHVLVYTADKKHREVIKSAFNESGVTASIRFTGDMKDVYRAVEAGDLKLLVMEGEYGRTNHLQNYFSQKVPVVSITGSIIPAELYLYSERPYPDDNLYRIENRFYHAVLRDKFVELLYERNTALSSTPLGGIDLRMENKRIRDRGRVCADVEGYVFEIEDTAELAAAAVKKNNRHILNVPFFR